MAPVVAAYQAMRGASFLVAVIFAAEIGDVRRFDTPRQLMSFLGLVPAESSTGDTVRRKGLTLAGNRRARRALVEAAWTYRYPARSQRDLESPARRTAQVCARHRLEGAGPSVRPLSSPQRHGQEGACRRGRDCPRNGRLPLGHRTGGRASVRERCLLPLRRAGGGARRWGTPLASYVAGPHADARPLDRGKSRDEDTEGGTQHADKSLINRRLSLRSQLCAAIASFAGGYSPFRPLTRVPVLDGELKRLARISHRAPRSAAG